jgi:hypothetical protein
MSKFFQAVGSWTGRRFSGPGAPGWLGGLVLLGCGMMGVPDASAATRAANISGKCEAYTIVSGLQEPSGLAFHPQTKELYVSEKKAGRISVIRNGQRQTVIESGWTVDKAIPAWAISSVKTREFLSEPKLHNPAAIAFSANGTLFVVENRAHGRVLEFLPDEKGEFTKARLIPIPWLSNPFSWEDVKTTADGRLFVVGYDAQGAGPLYFGSVLFREPNDVWWVVDYGPFSKFSGITLSRGEDVLVVAERVKGEIVTWDGVRHMPIGTVPNTVAGGAEVQATSLMKDGSFLIAEIQPAANRKGSSRLVQIHPITGQATGVADGFDRIGKVILSRETGTMFVSDEEAGVVYEVRPSETVLATEYLLQRSLDAFESEQGFSPRAAPAFLKTFLGQVGARPSDESARIQGAKGEPEKKDVAFGSSFTLREFAAKIPMVAGRVKTILTGEEADPDPVSEVDFMLFFPAHTLKATDLATPSLSFFSAKRKSGKLEQTRVFMEGLKSVQRVSDQWLPQSENARIYVPLATCGMNRYPGGVDLSLTFLGLGVYDDYILRLTTGKENRGSLIVEGKYGSRVDYRLSFVEEPTIAGAEPITNLVVAGFDPAIKSESLGWLNIGSSPVGASVVSEDVGVPDFASASDELKNLLQRKELEWRQTIEQQVEEAGPPPDTESAEPEPEPGPAGADETPAEAAPPAAEPESP